MYRAFTEQKCSRCVRQRYS